jgi:hypothetical protein
MGLSTEGPPPLLFKVLAFEEEKQYYYLGMDYGSFYQ